MNCHFSKNVWLFHHFFRCFCSAAEPSCHCPVDVEVVVTLMLPWISWSSVAAKEAKNIFSSQAELQFWAIFVYLSLSLYLSIFLSLSVKINLHLCACFWKFYAIRCVDQVYCGQKRLKTFLDWWRTEAEICESHSCRFECSLFRVNSHSGKADCWPLHNSRGLGLSWGLNFVMSLILESWHAEKWLLSPQLVKTKKKKKKKNERETWWWADWHSGPGRLSAPSL